MKKNVILLLQVMMLVGFSPGWAQQVTASAGQNHPLDDGYLSFTLGEPIVETYLGTPCDLSQGFQQPLSETKWNADMVSSAGNANAGHIRQVAVYPNPVRGELSVTFQGSPGVVNLAVRDMYGRTLLEKRNAVTTETVRLNLSEIPAQPLMLEIHDPESGETETRHVLKINY